MNFYFFLDLIKIQTKKWIWKKENMNFQMKSGK